ncbi:MAG: hypothetical protein DLM66_07680 [Candidatus Dormiibacter spiritus]|nr:MAG: hypothetical protein DLM66_07680 [Candidatus Dormibacteraeota bacterium]
MTTTAAPGGSGASRRPRSQLLIRTLSGLLILAIVVVLVAVGRPGLWLLAAVLGGISIWEFRRLSGLIGHQAPLWLLYPLAAYFALSGTVLKPVPVLAVLAGALVAGLTALLFLPPRRDGLGRWAFALAGALYVGLPFNYYLQLYEAHAGFVGQLWLVAVISTVVVSDSAAYLIGRALGRHPFFPAISPKKTWEGAIAGVVFCAPVMGLAGALLLHIGPWHGIALGLLVGLSAEFGDLVESQLKRLAGVKDSSQLIPGHGGLLDRLDSIFFPPIVVYLYLQAQGLL